MQSLFQFDTPLQNLPNSLQLEIAPENEENLLFSQELPEDSLLIDLENPSDSGNSSYVDSDSSPKSTDSFFDDSESLINPLPSIMENEIDIFEGVSFVVEDFKDPQLIQFDVNGNPLETMENQENFDESSLSFPLLDFGTSEDFSASSEGEEKIQVKEEKKGKKRGRKPGKKQQVKKVKTEIKEEEYLPTKETTTKNRTKSSSSNKKTDEKYMKRLIANKKSAQASRERKKALRIKLEENLSLMSTENIQLSDEIKKLEEENQELKNQFANLRNLIRESSILNSKTDPSESTKVELPKEIPAEPSELLKLSEGTTPASNAASLYLMVLLYSFSQHFKSGGINANSIPNLSAIQGILNQNICSSPVMV
eukprot:TRINITY_DN635_c0_g1_i1.p1 TRINITY_DN635_c0_g1~~TRINITY_DN635_c0_g1_i1.p1  ORF type:complete len:367 (+),score=169.62 TRINITY_DN635_c0_g1_i1:259-1359(+)